MKPAGLAFLIALTVPSVAGVAPTEIEMRFPGHDPSARWTAAGTLAMVFAREEADGGRLYYADSLRPGVATAVSPPGVRVLAQPQTGPSLEVMPDRTLVVVYSVAVPAKRGSELRAQRSIDGGASWSPPVRVNDDETPGPHGWVSTAVDASGGVQIAWLDKRTGEQGLVWTRTRDGIHFEANRVVDSRVCFCCATALLAGTDGRSWISYRDLEGKDLRNIAMVARTADGRFSAPAPVSEDGWRIDGCPDSGPRLALAPKGGVWAVWFDGAAPGIFSAFSSDGNRFSPRVQVASPAPDGAVPNHPDLAVFPDGRVVALYVSRATILGRVLGSDRKSWGNAVSLAEKAAEPRIAARAGRYALTFTAHDGSDLFAVAQTKTLERLAAAAR